MDGNCGKTSLLYSLTHKRFLGKYLPTVLDHYGVEVDIDGQQVGFVDLSIFHSLLYHSVQKLLSSLFIFSSDPACSMGFKRLALL